MMGLRIGRYIRADAELMLGEARRSQSRPHQHRLRRKDISEGDPKKAMAEERADPLHAFS